MKKVITVILASIFISLVGYAQTENTVKKEYEVTYFNSLEVSNMLTVNLEQTTREYLHAEFPEEVLPYLVVKVRDNTLYAYIDWDKASRKVYNKYTGGEYTDKYIINVGIVNIRELDASGVAKINVLNPCKVNSLEIDLSGAASINGEFTGAGNIEIDLSGASASDLTLNNFHEISIDCSGASKANVTSQCNISEIGASGASEVKYALSRKSTRIEIDAAGASKIDISGETQHAEIEGSGAAKIDARHLLSDTISIELSGASNLDIQQNSKISYIETSGASSVTTH